MLAIRDGQSTVGHHEDCVGGGCLENFLVGLEDASRWMVVHRRMMAGDFLHMLQWRSGNPFALATVPLAGPARACNARLAAAAALAAAGPILSNVLAGIDCGAQDMPLPRTAKQILAEWHELALRREEAADSDIADGLAARIELLRREYMEGTPPDEAPEAPSPPVDDEPRIQTKLPF